MQNTVKKLRNWTQLEYEQAEHNLRESKSEPEGYYHRYNAGRAAALRGVLDMLDVINATEAKQNTQVLTSYD